MSVNSKTPMALYKANLELVLRIGTLLHETRRRWAQAGAAGTSEAIQRTLAQTERMLTTNDWSALSAMPGEEFWNSLGTGGGPLQGTVESAVRSQTEFAEGLKQAFTEWQQQSAEALGGNAMQPAPWAFADLKQAFNAGGRSATPAAEDKAAKSTKPAAKPAAKAKAKAKARPPASKASSARKPSKAPATKTSSKPKSRKPTKK
ncbi:MAG: phasin family protein [Xanthomonadales bacterium]|nr:phasin family protein [Xanthomonadales bacterium]